MLGGVRPSGERRSWWLREAAVRRETLEERGEDPGTVLREVSRLPRRIGYHLGPE